VAPCIHSRCHLTGMVRRVRVEVGRVSVHRAVRLSVGH